MGVIRERRTLPEQSMEDPSPHTFRPARIRRQPTELAMDTLSYRSVGNSFLAGYIAGTTGTIIGHPFDSIKVWMQTRHHNHHPHHASSWSAAVNESKLSWSQHMRSPNSRKQLLIHSFRRLRVLYAGVSGPLISVGLVQSINFGVYDASRRMLYGLDHPHLHQSQAYLHNDSLTNIGIASMSAGAVLAIFTLPMLTIKTQQQTRQIGFRQALSELSWRQILRAIVPHFLTETAGRGVYFVTYEGMKRQLLRENQTKDISLQYRMLCAAISGITSWSVIFPLDALRCQILAAQHLGDDKHKKKSLWQVVRHMHQQQGWRGFYRGFSVTVLRAGPVAAAVLPVYDIALETLSSW